MIIELNGEKRDAPAGASVMAVLEMIGMAPGRVAVEVNGRVVHREEFPRLVLCDRDRVEIVQFVGGG